MRGGQSHRRSRNRRSPRVPPVATPSAKGALIGTRSVPLTAITSTSRERLVECTKESPNPPRNCIGLPRPC